MKNVHDPYGIAKMKEKERQQKIDSNEILSKLTDELESIGKQLGKIVNNTKNKNNWS
ncbi:hypothetical protein [Anaeromicrobium sediminis]|uniref:hypothetical protein n=1 Tax=Anaeromicrobium sediminis TaxID=1478221 RepID=UPI001594FA1C|nr:hypothetical protein [Anaeromicrobium sediminis]